MSGRLAGKVAIVTGAGSRGPGVGNGKAASMLFAREGARVLCVDRVKERAEETVGLIRAERGEAAAFAADVTRAADCHAMVEAAVGHWGGLDVLHNNVGIESRHGVMVTLLSSSSFGYERARPAAMTFSSARASSTETPSFKRPSTSRY